MSPDIEQTTDLIDLDGEIPENPTDDEPTVISEENVEEEQW